MGKRLDGQRRRTRRSGSLIPVAVAVALFVLVSSAAAATGVRPVANPSDEFTPAVMPLGASSTPVTAMVQLGAKPIVVQDAESKDAGHGALSDSQRQQIRQQLQAAQAPVEQQIRQLGGQVLGDYQAAYDGVKTLIPASKLASLGAISGVVSVHRMIPVQPSNTVGVPQIGGPLAWDGLNGVHGEGIKIADIDTGIDYTHADFGGSGNPADFALAAASSTLPANPLWFGPTAPKVKGGIDLVGDSYNADPSSSTYQPVPQPDPNPLDCNGHGTHTAGTAAGFGVLSDGSTYAGPYNKDTVASHSWNVGPGVAPKADIYAVRVFGCSGSTNMVVDAIEWAVDNHMDVINMSLGSPFGSPTDPDAVAATNAAHDGVIVVSASGNNGPAPYITSSPGAAAGTLAVAAEDPHQSFAGATLSLSTGTTLTAIDANGFSPLAPGPFTVKVIYSAPGVISLGCSVAADGGAASLPANTVIVVARGTCARVAKAIFGQQAGAAGVIMVNNSSALPPFEGKITSNPDTGEKYTVTIPFFGVRGGSSPSTSATGQQLIAADGGTVTVAAALISNPGYAAAASFSSFGPDGSNSLKPQVTAPGVSIASAGMGTGTEAVIESGTSMATPHTTGAAALVKQAHPDWGKAQYWEAALENTADSGLLTDFGLSGAVGEGAGLIQVQNAVKTNVVAIGGESLDDLGTLDFGLATLDRDYSQHGRIVLRNFGSTPATFSVADQADQGSPHTLTVGQSQVTVPAHGAATVDVQLSVPAATAGAALDPVNGYLFNSVSGQVVLTPAAGSNNGVALRVPYLLVPQAISHVRVSAVNLGQLKQGTVGVTLRNDHAAATGVMDWFAWGLKDKATTGLGSDDLLNAGVQSLPGAGLAIFAIQTAHRWANPAEDEFDVLIDVNNDGTPDYLAAAVDYGAIATGSYNGMDVVAVIPLVGSKAGKASVWYLAGADYNGTTIELPVGFAQLCRGVGAPCPQAGTPISYTVQSWGKDGTADAFASSALFDLYHPAISSANFEDTVAPGGSATDSVTLDPVAWKAAPQLGVMVVSQNNLAHDNREEALTVPIPFKP